MPNKALQIESVTKATQTCELLLQDLKEVNGSGPLMSMICLPEIERVSHVHNRLKLLLSSIESREGNYES